MLHAREVFTGVLEDGVFQAVPPLVVWWTSQNTLVKQLNKAVKYAVDNPIMLRIPRSEPEIIRVIGFAD